MYHLYKDDPWGNKIAMMVATKPYADQILKTCRDTITRIVPVPGDRQSLIM